MVCIHDVIDLQAALCVRHYIDFFHLAVLKQHLAQTLLQMKASLIAYNQLSPIFETVSPVRFSCFK